MSRRRKSKVPLWLYSVFLLIGTVLIVNNIWQFSVFLKQNEVSISLIFFVIGSIVWIADKTYQHRMW